jgi:CheY-like chemotaxis protein
MPAEASTAHLRVLIADDRRDASHVMRILLQRAGHEVTVVENLAGALESVSHSRFDVIISDIALDGMRDGCELARSVRGDTTVPLPLLIAVTGYSDDQTRRDALEAGFDHFLVKPPPIQDLLALLAKVNR